MRMPTQQGETGRETNESVLNGGLKLGGAVLATAVFAGLLAFAGAPTARADDDYDCQRRVMRADRKLHEAVERHGWDSRQADHWRHELHEARERCWRERQRW